MGDRDLLLVLNIVDYLLETAEGERSAQEFRAMVSDTLSNREVAQDTLENEEIVAETVVLKEASEEGMEETASQLTLEEELKTLRAKNKALEEQVTSQQQVAQMTIESMMSQVLALEETKATLTKYEQDYKAQSNRLFEQTSSQLEMMQMTIEFLTEQVKDTESQNTELTKYEQQYKRQGKIMMEQVDSQLSMMQMTIEFLTSQVKNLETANESLETSRAYSKKQEEILIEQVSSQLDMFQMTHEFQMNQLKELENEIEQHKHVGTERLQLFQALSRNVLTSYFDSEAKLNALFSNVLLYPKTDEGSQKSFVCVIEKFGIIYLILVKSEIEEDLADLFQLISNFALSNVIGIKKYVNPSRIIEEYLSYMKSIQNGSNSLNVEALELGVCLIDNINLEVEFASTGLSLYSSFKATIEEHESNATFNAPKAGIGRVSPRDNQYRIRKLGFRKGGSMYLTSQKPNDAFTHENGEKEVKVKELIQQVGARGFPEGYEYLNNFSETYKNSSGEKAKGNFFLLGITF